MDVCSAVRAHRSPLRGVVLLLPRTSRLGWNEASFEVDEFDDYTLPSYLNPIEASFSLDDVSGAGRVIRFDKSGRTATAAPAVNSPTED